MKFLLACLLILFPPFAYALPEGFVAQVVGVHDGDTLTVLDDTMKQFKIRMAEIDAPEAKQDYGSRSKQMLSDLVFGKIVLVRPLETDRYGRLVAHVSSNGRDINQIMIEQGGAWVYRQYSKTPAFIGIEAKARNAKVGLWAGSRKPVPPWEWRRAKRARK